MSIDRFDCRLKWERAGCIDVSQEMRRTVSFLSRTPTPLVVVRASLIAWVVLSIPTCLPAQEATKAKPATDDTENLLKEFPKGWLHFSSEPTSPLNATWQIRREPDDAKDAKEKEFVLVCLGKPDGYVRTEKEYENFELGMEWKYPTDPNGNSGILLYTLEKDMIWPKSVQVQLHRPTAGSVFPSIGAKVDNPLPAKDLSRAVNEWNECVITSFEGKLSVTVNGHKIGDVTGCMPQKGCVGLQSEGSEIHFRKLWIKPLGPSEKRVSSRKLSARHKKVPVCPPQFVTTNLADGKLLLLAPDNVHRTRAESQRIARAMRRFELHGKLPPSTFRGLSPFADIDSPTVP